MPCFIDKQWADEAKIESIWKQKLIYIDTIKIIMCTEIESGISYS